jgi:hypothetical protein
MVLAFLFEKVIIVRKLVICSTPYCDNSILLRDFSNVEIGYIFCPKCKVDHSLRVLKTQVDHEKSIREVILESRIFKSANGMADYVGVSFVTMYNWIQKYFGMSFQEFRRTYICKSNNCYLLNIERSSYSRSDYILKKIRSRSNFCACINSLEPNYIMTNCPQYTVSSILRGYPVIKKISDKVFSLAPKPILFIDVKSIHFDRKVKPLYLRRPKPMHFKQPRSFHFFSKLGE